MLDRILDERREHHRRHARREQRRRGIDGEVQALAHADLLHAQVRRDEVDLLGERAVVRAHAWQRGAQVARELSEHGAFGTGIGVAQPPHIGERIEEEMRLDLRLQEPQAGRELLCLELAAAQVGRERLLLCGLRAQVVNVAGNQHRARAEPGSKDEKHVARAFADRDSPHRIAHECRCPGSDQHGDDRDDETVARAAPGGVEHQQSRDQHRHASNEEDGQA